MTAAAAPQNKRLLLCLYLVAGIPLGVFGDVMPAYLRSEGVSLKEIGFFSMLHLPYSFKIFLAPWVDCSGHIRRFLLFASTALACAYVWLAYIPVQQAAWRLGAALLLMTSCSALFDVALDATFMRSLSGRSAAQQAGANAWRLSAFKFAMMATGSGVVILGGILNFRVAFCLLALVHAVLLACVPWRQMPRTAGMQQSWRVWGGTLWQWLRRRRTRQAFALAFTYKMSIASLLVLERAFWVDRGASLQRIGITGAAVSVVSVVAGAQLGSALAHRMGILVMLYAGLLAQSIAAGAYFGLVYLPANITTLALGLCLSGVTFGLATAALMSLITRICGHTHAATQFAALTGAYGLSRAMAGAGAGAVAQHFGYSVFFAAAAWLVLPALLLLPRSRASRRAWHVSLSAA